MSGVRALIACALVALGLTALSAAPAHAAPGQVQPPWVSAAGPTNLVVSWKPVSGATQYQLLWSTSYSMTAAASRKTTGAPTSFSIGGLKPGKVYCVQVRALNGSSAGSKSSRHCKWTMIRANVTTAPVLRIATYNVCGKAGPCADGQAHAFAGRKAAIVERVQLAGAEVIAFQETASRVEDLTAMMEPLGYTFLAESSVHTEALFYDADVYEPVTETTPGGETVPRSGTIAMRGNFTYTALWAELRHRESGLKIHVVNAHEREGKGLSIDQERYKDTLDLIAQVKALTPARTRVFAGDFNSHRNRDFDGPGQAFREQGFHDTYDSASAFSLPRNNSYTGWGTTPTTSTKFGDHVDHVYVDSLTGATNWRVVHELAGGLYTTPVPSDHSPVRVALYLH